MGRLVRFQSRPGTAEAKTEQVLQRLKEHYLARRQAEAELPAVLAELVREGQTDLVLSAITLWGSGQMEPHEVLTQVEQMAAVAGIKSVGNRPLHR